MSTLKLLRLIRGKGAKKMISRVNISLVKGNFDKTTNFSILKKNLVALKR